MTDKTAEFNDLAKDCVCVANEPPTPVERRASIAWAQCLKGVFNNETETCTECVSVIANIEGPVVIKKILDHLRQ